MDLHGRLKLYDVRQEGVLGRMKKILTTRAAGDVGKVFEAARRNVRRIAAPTSFPGAA